MSDSSTAKTFTRVRAVEREVLGGRRLVQALRADRPTHLSGSAPVIWDLLAEHDTFDALASMLQAHYSDPPEVIRSGLELGIQSLVDAGLVVES